jgi:hypothetical protein
MDAFAALASSCSVSFREKAEPAKLRAAFLTGMAPLEIIPHLTVALNESPTAMLFAAVLACDEERQPQVLENLRALARAVGAEARIAAWLRG